MPDYTAGKARILLEPSARGFFTKAKAALRTEAGDKKLEQDVQLKPSTKRFRADADAQLRTMRGIEYKVNLRPNISNRSLFRSDAKAQAETHLKGLYATMTVRGMVDMTYANNQLRAWRVKEEAKPLKIRVITEHVGGVGRPTGATSMIRHDTPRLQPDRAFAFGHDVPIIKPTVDDRNVRQGVEKIKRDVQRPGNQPVVTPHIRTDESEIRRELKRLQEALRPPRRLPGPSIRGVELLAPAMLSIATESAPALATALGDVVGAINEMAGAALAAPGALAVLGTSIGTLALGVSGMKAAWKALQQQQDQAANSAASDALKQDQQNEQLRHGLYDVQKAQEDLTKARKEARRELEDLHAEERSSYLSVAEAALDLQKARNELSKPSEGPLDYNEKILAELKARESLSQAIRRQNRTREDTAAADRKGIESSDKVREAQEALVRSNEQIAMTLKQIQEGSAGAANATDKVKNAMSQLSPNAAELTQALFDLKNGPLTDLAKISSQNMFAGMSNGIKALVNADMPMLSTGIARVSTAINRNFNTVLSSLNTDQNRGLLSRIFGNTEEFHKRLNAAIDPAIRSISQLAATGSDAMPKLATGFAHLTDRFAKFIDKADKEGRLDQWINHGIASVESFGRTLGNIAKTVHSIGQAFGGGLTGNLETWTRKMAAFFASGRGQNDLLSMARLTRREFEEWKPILQDLPAIFSAVFGGVRTTMGGLLPILNVFTSALKAFPGLGQAGAAAFLSWRAMRPIMVGLSAATMGFKAAVDLLPAATRGAGSKVAAEAALMSGAMSTSGGRIRNIINAIPAAMTGAMTRVRASVAGVATTVMTPLQMALANAVNYVQGTWGGRMVSSATTTMGRFGGVLKNVGSRAVGGLSTALGSVASFMSGPWGIAIAAAVVALQGLLQANNDARDSADANREAQEKLASSFDDVTNAAGAATRAQLSKELENYQPKQGLQGNVREAAEGMGVDRDRLLRAALPGGAEDARSIYQQARQSLRGPILNAAGKGVTETLGKQGFSEDDLVDAYLGDEGKVKRLQEILNGPRFKIDSLIYGVSGFNLNEITQRLAPDEQHRALVPQYLSHTVPNMQRSQSAAQQAQRTATGGDPTLTDTAAGIFGPGAKPSYDGTTAKIEIPGDFEHAPETKDRADRLKQSGNTFRYDPFRRVTTMTVGTDDQAALVNVPTPPSREKGGPSPEIGQRGPTGGIISELHPGEWVLPKHARSRLGDDWLAAQTSNKAVNPAAIRGSYEIGGPAPLAPFLPPLAPASGDGPPLDPNAPGEATPPVNPPLLPGQGAGPRPGPANPPAAPTTPTSGPGAAGGVPHMPGQAADPNAPVNVGRTPDGATPAESADLNQPGPTVDPSTGQLTSPQAHLPDFGTSLKDSFLAPWGMKTDPNSGQIVSSQPREVTQKAQEAYLGKWAGGFAVSFGETLLNGVAGFFGLNIDNPYFQAFKQTIGFYSGKVGAQADQYVDPTTQSVVGQQVNGYQQLVDPATGTTYLIPTDASGGAAGDPSAPLGDVSQLPVGKAPEGGLQPNAVKTERAISAAFPEIRTIGGVRSDPLKWHPSGLALDVMMPGMEGMDNNATTTPAALAEGNKIWAWMQQHADELGIDMSASLWQQPDHHNHIHVAVYGKNNPKPGAKDPSGDAPAAADPGGAAEAPGAAAGPELPPLSSIAGPPHAGAPGGPPSGAANKPGWINGVPQGWHDYGAPASATGKLWIYPDGAPAFADHNDWRHPPKGWTWHSENSPPGIAGWLAKDTFTGTPAWPDSSPGAGPAGAPPGAGPAAGGGSGPHTLPIIPGRGGGTSGPLGGFNSNDLFGGGGGGGSAMAGRSGRGRVVVLPRGATVANLSQLLSGRSATGGVGAGIGAPGMAGGEPAHDKTSVARYIFSAAKAEGYNDHDALAIAAYAQGESGMNPGISGGNQGAGGSAGSNADEVIGLFQEKAGFAQAGGVDPASRFTVSGNVRAYLNQLRNHRQGDIYDRLLATSVGGPMYTGGRGAMAGLEEQVRTLLGMPTAQAQHMHYQKGGLLPEGVTVAHHDDPKPDIVIPYADAQRAVQHINATPAPPDVPNAQRMAPQPPPEVNIPRALPPPGPQAAAPPPQPPPVDQAPPQPAPTATLPSAPGPNAAPSPTPGPDSGKSYEHPGLKQAVTSGAAAAGNIASMAASAMGGGMGGPLIAGLFQQGGKIANDAINVGAAFASGFLKFGGTTQNPYGVMEKRQDAPPGLGADNRRVHMGNNYFASMDEWRRQNQLQDAQDMQAGMARMRQ